MHSKLAAGKQAVKLGKTRTKLLQVEGIQFNLVNLILWGFDPIYST